MESVNLELSSHTNSCQAAENL